MYLCRDCKKGIFTELAHIFSLRIAMSSVCLCVCVCHWVQFFFRGLSLALRSQDQFPWKLGILETWILRNMEKIQLFSTVLTAFNCIQPFSKIFIRFHLFSSVFNHFSTFSTFFLLVLLSAHAEIFSVSRMRDFL